MCSCTQRQENVLHAVSSAVLYITPLSAGCVHTTAVCRVYTWVRIRGPIQMTVCKEFLIWIQVNRCVQAPHFLGFHVLLLCRGYTPLDVCTFKMQSLRDVAGISGTFTHHEAAFMALTDCLQQAGALQDTTAVASLPYYKSKHGCTCGECKSGFMSARMKER